MIKNKFSLDFQWPTREPFLFCAHHLDRYPAGTAEFGPEKSHLKGRDIGQDFQMKDGFRMYHGDVVPGFPVHPHRGFETITIVRKGYVDHADSLGAAGRYGEGDVQWMTGGKGVQHSEMFPLLHQDKNNVTELFQIWLNLPKRSKMVDAHFKMFWSENIPRVNLDDSRVRVDIIAGSFNGAKALSPPPESWAAQPENDVLILLIKMKPQGKIKIPPSKHSATRTLYFFEGESLHIDDEVVSARTGFEVDSQKELELRASGTELEVLLLQACPIGEPTVQYGPFVMNTKEDIIQTIAEYQKDQFGGWPWPRQDMVHGGAIERFAKYPDGRIEKPGNKLT